MTCPNFHAAVCFVMTVMKLLICILEAALFNGGTLAGCDVEYTRGYEKTQ